MGEGVGVGEGEGVGEGTGRQAAWAWGRARAGRHTGGCLIFSLVFSLYTKIYHTVSLELMKRWVNHGELPPPRATQPSYPLLPPLVATLFNNLFFNSSVIDC